MGGWLSGWMVRVVEWFFSGGGEGGGRGGWGGGVRGGVGSWGRVGFGGKFLIIIKDLLCGFR